jgi:dihydroorotase
MTDTPGNQTDRRQAMALGLATVAAAAMTGMASGSAAAQGAAPQTAAGGYDLVIKGGRVIDPAAGVNGMSDVAISGDRIALVAPNIAAGTARVVNASGKLVLPGLIDIHTHCAQYALGPAMLVQDGVTGWIEAGSKGADNIADAIPTLAASPQTHGFLVNIGRRGMGGGKGDLQPFDVVDVAACAAAIKAHPGVVVGVKARLDQHDSGENDIAALKAAEEATTPLGVPVMIHIGDTFSSLDKILPLLKAGDIITHVEVPPPHSMFDESFHLIPEAVAARKRGVIFDVGHGSAGHFGWDFGEKVTKAGFVPDTTSTDYTAGGHNNGTLSIPTMMTNLLYLGYSLEKVVAMVTINAANCFPIFKGRGTIKAGSPADVALLEMRQGNFELWDSLTPKSKRMYKQKLFASATIIGGKVLWQSEFGIGGLR